MKWILIISCAAFWMISGGTPDLELLRSSYPVAAGDKQMCKNMIARLSQTGASPLHRAYLGGFRAMWAKHAFNPLVKLSTFHKGKSDIEAALQAEPDNVEIRFIRLSVQKNCPSFLGYNADIETDTRILSASRKMIISPSLRAMIDNVLHQR